MNKSIADFRQPVPAITAATKKNGSTLTINKQRTKKKETNLFDAVHERTNYAYIFTLGEPRAVKKNKVLF